MYIILLLMSCLGVVVTITGFIIDMEMLVGMGCILISPAYIFILLCLFGVIKFPETPNGD